ncbi:hypothetical protein PVAG01_01942 [Phlyctema vagabunda]|uniref:Protein kinase domain-containing protein n=1 Tax=Phlyctema vagabunda TaxID=108571 RepID=A0ABR4PYL4_9HELO
MRLQWFLNLFVFITDPVQWLWDWSKRLNQTQNSHIIQDSCCVRGDLNIRIFEPIAPTLKIESNVRDSKGECLAGGASGIIERLPSGNVVKSPWTGSREYDCRRDITIESDIYERLGPHPRLLQIINWDPEDCVLTMEYLPNGSLKDFLLAQNDKISIKQRLHWPREAAEGLQLLHDADVIHCDVEPRNFLIDANLSLKIGDFGGSSLRGSQPSACAPTRFLPPDFDWRRQPTIEDDLFGLGSTIYFIMTGQYPFAELGSDEVEANFRARRFPSVEGILCGDIFKQCWSSEIASAQVAYNLIQVVI